MKIYLIFPLVDIIISLTLISHEFYSLLNQYIFILGIFILLKGLWSYFTAAAAGFYYDWLGMIDALAGSSILLTLFRISSPIFLWIGIGLMLKGLFTFITIR